MRSPFTLTLAASCALLLSAVSAQTPVEAFTVQLGPATHHPARDLPLDIPAPPVAVAPLPDHGQGRLPVPLGHNDLPEPDSPPTRLQMTGGGPGAPCTGTVHRLAAGPSGGARNLVGEPSVAMRALSSGAISSGTVFLTWNSAAARSKDGGGSWTLIDPATKFPAVDGGFCCDQRVVYIPKWDITVWYLQYLYSATTQRGSQRLAVSVGNNLDAGADGTWHSYLLNPGDFGRPQGELLDFPDIAFSDKYLYLSTNSGNPQTKRLTASFVARFPLSQLKSAASGLSVEHASLGGGVGPYRLTQHADTEMYFATHKDTATLRVFRWKDTNILTRTDHAVAAWIDAGFVTSAPNGTNWANLGDRRILGGYVSCNEYGFLWGAAQNGSSRLQPYTRVARFNRSTDTKIADEDIHDSNFAIIYPAAVANGAGHVGVLVAYGSNTTEVGTAYKIVDDCDPNFAGGTLWGMVTGSHSPATPFWGDYFSIQRHPFATMKFCGVGMALQGGDTELSQRSYYAYFGRERDVIGTLSATARSCGAPKPTPGTPGVTITCSPPDKLGRTSTVDGYFSYDPNVVYSLTAPASHVAGGVYAFCYWRHKADPNGEWVHLPDGQLTMTVDIQTEDDVNEAVYAVARRITVGSRNPTSGIAITVSRADVLGNQDGTSQFERHYKPGSGTVTFSAPPFHNTIHPFKRWWRDGVAQPLGELNVTVDTADASPLVEAEYYTHIHGTITPFGAGCQGSNSLTPNHTCTDDPHLGSTVTYRAGNLLGSAVLWLGLSNTDWGGISLPFSLGLIGADPSCNLLVSRFAELPMTAQGGGNGAANFRIPARLGIGADFYTQVIAIDSGVSSPLKITVSNGLHTRTGGDQ